MTYESNEPYPQRNGRPNDSAAIPSEFGFEKEHPAIDLPFSVNIDGTTYAGISLSVTHVYLHQGEAEPLADGSVHIVRITIPLGGFSVTMDPEVRVVDMRGNRGLTLQFIDPTGPHLPQLRYILNSVIAGDVVNLDSMLHYTGPGKPQAARDAAAVSIWHHMRSFAAIILSLLVVAFAAVVLYQRSTTIYETRPVFVVREGQEMRATSAGQLTFINPEAAKGDVLFTIYANSGDALNFEMPCDCELKIAENIQVGATLLPIDRVATLYTSNDSSDVVAQTLMSVEGLNRALAGDQMTLIMQDGRELDAELVIDGTANAATMRGDLFVPVNFMLSAGTLSTDDIGQSARLRLSSPAAWAQYIPDFLN